MSSGAVYYNNILAGILEKTEKNLYVYTYIKEYLQNTALPPISLSFPKKEISYESMDLFPFFYGLLAEGINKDIQCRLLKIDENDDFTRLIKTAYTDTIGAVTVHEIKNNKDVPRML